MKWIAVFLILSALTGPALGAPVEAQPASIYQGDVSKLLWGEEPPVEASVNFRGRTIPLCTLSGRLAGLLGADLETPPGLYPVGISMVDRQGRKRTQRLMLEVLAKEFPVERLSLPPAMVSPQDPEVLDRIVEERQMIDTLFKGQSQERYWTDFRRPVEDALGSRFGRRRILNGEPRSPHAGVDFRSPAGTPVEAPAGGRVVFAGDLFFTGRTVILDHGEGLYSLYAHLDQIKCGCGDRLDQGQVLGLVGKSGRATGPHLHWGVKLRGDRIDPMILVDLFGGEKN